MSMKDRVRRPSTCRPHPKVKFTKEEDEKLRSIVAKYGESDWDMIADMMPGRNQRQCRERWLNYLSPSVNKEPWTREEDQLLIDKHNELGSRWVKIARFFTGRSDTAIKNRWMVLQRKILLEGEEHKVQNEISVHPNGNPMQMMAMQQQIMYQAQMIQHQQQLLSFQQQNFYNQQQNLYNQQQKKQQRQKKITQPPKQLQQPQKQQQSYYDQQHSINSNNDEKEEKQLNHIEHDSNNIDGNDEIDFWDEVFASNEFQSSADSFW